MYEYPGDRGDDGAKLPEIRHEHLVQDLFGLLDHLKISRAFLVGVSFGSTVALRAMHRGPRQFPRAAIVAGFSPGGCRSPRRIALRLAQLVPVPVSRLPFRRAVLTYNSKLEFPRVIEDRFPFYLEQHGLTPIRSLAHRISLLENLDLGRILPSIRSEVLLIQGNEDRIVPRRDHEILKSELPIAEGMILPTVGHQVQITHAELLARVLGDWFLPCPPQGCAE